MKKRLLNSLLRTSPFVRFVLVGGFATALHYGLYLLLRCLMVVNLAYTIGYGLSFLANFYLTAWFTFQKPPTWHRGIGFGGAHLVNYLLHMGVFNFLLWTGVPSQWAPMLVYATVVPVNFLLVRFVFKK